MLVTQTFKCHLPISNQSLTRSAFDGWMAERNDDDAAHSHTHTHTITNHLAIASLPMCENASVRRARTEYIARPQCCTKLATCCRRRRRRRLVQCNLVLPLYLDNSTIFMLSRSRARDRKSLECTYACTSFFVVRTCIFQRTLTSICWPGRKMISAVEVKVHAHTHAHTPSATAGQRSGHGRTSTHVDRQSIIRHRRRRQVNSNCSNIKRAIAIAISAFTPAVGGCL